MKRFPTNRYLCSGIKLKASSSIKSLFDRSSLHYIHKYLPNWLCGIERFSNSSIVISPRKKATLLNRHFDYREFLYYHCYTVAVILPLKNEFGVPPDGGNRSRLSFIVISIRKIPGDPKSTRVRKYRCIGHNRVLVI